MPLSFHAHPRKGKGSTFPLSSFITSPPSGSTTQAVPHIEVWVHTHVPTHVYQVVCSFGVSPR